MSSSSEDKELTHKAPSLQIIRGFKIAVAFDKTIIEEILDFMPQDGDVILATYPKTGTTWMSYIIHQILTKGESYPSFEKMLRETIPFLEKTGLKALKNTKTKPRVYKHHIPYNFLKKNPNSKIIYVYRKPEDTFVSYYYFIKELYEPRPIDFNKYFDDFLSGNISFGRYFEHILSYLECKNDGNILFVSYEKLKIQTKEEILRVAKFLGEEYYELLANDELLLSKIIEQTSFKFMKSNLSDRIKSSEGDSSSAAILEKDVTFFRKGKIGDGRECLTEDQLIRVKEISKEVMKGTEILFEWMQD